MKSILFSSIFLVNKIYALDCLPDPVYDCKLNAITIYGDEDCQEPEFKQEFTNGFGRIECGQIGPYSFTLGWPCGVAEITFYSDQNCTEYMENNNPWHDINTCSNNFPAAKEIPSIYLDAMCIEYWQDEDWSKYPIPIPEPT